MRFNCPVCKERIERGTPKPGRYQPRCPHCQKRFNLVVPAGGGPVQASARKEREESAGASNIVDRALEEARSDKSSRPAWHRHPAVRLVFGPRVRMVIGLVLLLGCLIWVYQNWQVSYDAEESREPGEARTVEEEVARTQEQRSRVRSAVASSGEELETLDRFEVSSRGEKQPLSLPLLPQGLSALLFNSFAPGLAGILLLMTGGISGGKVGVYLLPGLAIMLLGHVLGIGIAALDPKLLALIVGAIVMFLGIHFGRYEKSRARR
jgi:hypothetical protein